MNFTVKSPRDASTSLVVGLNIPASVGMAIDQVSTPALIVDLSAFEKNVETLRRYVDDAGVRLRAHAKTHRSVDIARYQIEKGGACGICCQKISEAEVLVAGGVDDVLVSNQVVDTTKIQRLAELAKKARVLVCVDDHDNVDDLSAAASAADATIECLVEIDCGAGRCGVPPGTPAAALATKIAASNGLRFAGLQAYQGSAQHVRDFDERKAKIDAAVTAVTETAIFLNEAGLGCEIIGGAGTGSYYFEATSGAYNELQCGSYVFMDADYRQVRDQAGDAISEFENSLFVLTTIMSKTKADKAICDAGLKAHSIDSGMPTVFGRNDLEYVSASDEHGVIADPANSLRLKDRLLLIPGHCDPTCNLYDWYVGVRDNKVEALWPVSARGMGY